MYACCRYNLFTYLVTLHTENLNVRFSFITQGVQLGGAVVSTAPTYLYLGNLVCLVGAPPGLLPCCFVGAFCFVGAVETTAPPEYLI